MDIQVILTEDDPKLGRRGEVVKVSRGHALNFLIPHNKARLATASSLKAFEAERAAREKKEAEALADATALAAKIQDTPVSVTVLTGEGGRLFGAVTAQDIVFAASERGVSLEKRQLILEEPIKKLGEHEVKIRLHANLQALLKVSVVKKKS
ncbi:MAG: 50S ribosomal protein L9 [Candidatus Omnitrophica bacterium]|nr:50S ribosomal protein L9 [Candidatus Omnitrophota bacterium]